MMQGQPTKRRRGRIRILVLIASVLLLSAAIILPHFSYGSAHDYPRPYADIVTQCAEAYDVPENLIYAVMKTESGFDSAAESHAGAVGLMQLMPSTFRWLSDEILFEYLEDEDIYDPEVNIRYGVYYLRRLYNRYGNWLTACAAYNAGPGNVNTWLEEPIRITAGGTLRPLFIPIRETQLYVLKIERTYAAYEHFYPGDRAPAFR